MERILSNAKNAGIAVAAISVAVLAIVVTTILTRDNSPAPMPDPPPEADVITEEQVKSLCGWQGEDVAKDAFQQLRDKFVPFVIWDTQRNAESVSQDKRSVLWDASLKILGQHIPNIPQQVGDCVSFGAANAVMYLQCVQALKDPLKYRSVFQPYIYGTSRVLVGRNRLGCNSDGSVGAWAAAAVQEHGILFSDASNVPAYSGRVAREWGCKRASFERFISEAKEHPVKSVARVTTWQEVRDALVNGYPVTVASDQGFEMRGRVREGKLFGVPRGNWAHQMCFVGYDPAPKPCFYVLNSWGPNAHGTNPDDAPPGGFWVDAAIVDRMVKQGDSFAFSAFVGFPEQWDWDIDILLQKGAKHGHHPAIRGNDREPKRLGSRDPHYAVAP